MSEDLAAENARLKATNRELHRRVQAAEGPLLSRVQNAEQAAEFWLARRKERGGEAARQRRRAVAAEAKIAELEANQSALREALNGLRGWVNDVIGHAPPEMTDDEQIGWLDQGLCETDRRICTIVATLLKPDPASTPIVKAGESA